MMGGVVQAVYNLLIADTGVSGAVAGVYSGRAPQSADGNLAAPFPFVVITGVTENPFNTKSRIGSTALVQVDLYARTQSDKAFYIIAGLIRDALEREPLGITGGHWIETEFVSMVPGFEDEGKTRRAVMDFRVTVQRED